MLKDELLQKIKSREAHLGIVGLGYVGLPLTLNFVERSGFRTTGFDVDEKKVEMLRRGETYIMHLGAERVKAARDSGRFDATTDFAILREVDVIIIAVPTPLTPQREPEMMYIVQTARQVRDHLQRGQLVVLESTTYPGTTDELVRGILEESGLQCGKDFFLAFSPEREDPGNPRYNTATIPKVVGGVDAASSEVACALYETGVDKVIPVSSARTAEATKLTENIFRAVNIALVNELKVVYGEMNIDVWEVLDAAATKPFGFMKFSPGPGLGGHCIPLDPFYLTWKAREYGLSTKFIELAGEVNFSMPGYVINRLQQALNDRERALRGSKVLVMGIAYKKDVDDPRESASFELIDLLLHRGTRIAYHDPYIPRLPRMRSWPDLRSVPSTRAASFLS